MCRSGDANAKTFAAIQQEYEAFSLNLKAFIDEQKKLQAAPPSSSRSSRRSRGDSVASATDADGNQITSDASRVAKLISKMQHRLTKKHSSSTWITKNITDMTTLATTLKSFSPEKQQRRDTILALDHFISAVLLSSTVKTTELLRLDVALSEFESASKDLAEFARSSRSLVTNKLESLQQTNSSSHPVEASLPMGIHAVDAQSFNTLHSNATAEEPSIKRLKTSPGDDFIVKVERQRREDHAGLMDALSSVHEVYVSDLPWGASQRDIESYFGVAGKIVSVRMPATEDGRTVGVAIIRFSSAEGANSAVHMDGYHFHGKSIHVALAKDS
ncbi:hypothetical protein PINS_up008790 [Pythium insidiosum]|nr:hypothetical protein PINS_up008790 [Pythium insidiosum]